MGNLPFTFLLITMRCCLLYFHSIGIYQVHCNLSFHTLCISSMFCLDCIPYQPLGSKGMNLDTAKLGKYTMCQCRPAMAWLWPELLLGILLPFPIICIFLMSFLIPPSHHFKLMFYYYFLPKICLHRQDTLLTPTPPSCV